MESFSLLNIKLHILFVSIRIRFHDEDNSSVGPPGIVSLAQSNKNLTEFKSLKAWEDFKIQKATQTHTGLLHQFSYH